MPIDVSAGAPPVASDTLPEWLRPFFWDTDFNKVSWQDNRDYVIRRLLSSGTFDAMRWVLAEIGEEALRQWILQHEGRGLSSRQLRFWQAVLDLPGERVDAWLNSEGRRLWEGRGRG